MSLITIHLQLHAVYVWTKLLTFANLAFLALYLILSNSLFSWFLGIFSFLICADDFGLISAKILSCDVELCRLQSILNWCLGQCWCSIRLFVTFHFTEVHAWCHVPTSCDGSGNFKLQWLTFFFLLQSNPHLLREPCSSTGRRVGGCAWCGPVDFEEKIEE
jgi:hypothetical protein